MYVVYYRQQFRGIEPERPPHTALNNTFNYDVTIPPLNGLKVKAHRLPTFPPNTRHKVGRLDNNSFLARPH